MIDDSTLLVGERLKTLRNERGLTLRDLADASGLSINTISLIERGKSSPTVATLYKLATALGVPVGFFVEEALPKEVVFQKAEGRPQARSVGLIIENLGSGLVDQTMEPLLLTLEPEADSGPDPIVHVGHEFVFCIEGRVAYEVDRQTYLLEPEDSLLFEARLSHRWRNVHSGPSRVLLILRPQGRQGDLLSRHL